jgi:hypothetical protein
MCAAKFALNFALTILLTLSTLKEFTDDHKVPIIHTFRASFLDCRRWAFLKILWILKEVLVLEETRAHFAKQNLPSEIPFYAREGAPPRVHSAS